MCLMVASSEELVMGFELFSFSIIVKGISGYINATVYNVEIYLLFAPMLLNCLLIIFAVYVFILSTMMLE